jgi:hypothetical protein
MAAALTPSEQRLADLKKAADTWFGQRRRYYNAEYDFLDEISKKRGGTVGLQDANAVGASVILEISINEYLGKAPEP